MFLVFLLQQLVFCSLRKSRQPLGVSPQTPHVEVFQFLCGNSLGQIPLSAWLVDNARVPDHWCKFVRTQAYAPCLASIQAQTLVSTGFVVTFPLVLALCCVAEAQHGRNLKMRCSEVEGDKSCSVTCVLNKHWKFQVQFKHHVGGHIQVVPCSMLMVSVSLPASCALLFVNASFLDSQTGALPRAQDTWASSCWMVYAARRAKGR